MFRIRADQHTWHREVLDAIDGQWRSRAGVVDLPHPDGRSLITLEVVGGRSSWLSLQIEGRVTIDLRRTRKGGFSVEVVAGAVGLWQVSGGIHAWMEKWLRIATHWFLAKAWAGVSSAEALGWRVGRLELCSDFTGFCVDRNFVYQLHTKQRGELIREELPKARFAGNIQIGARKAESIGMSIHNKTRQVRKKRGLEAVDSIYASTFRDPFPSSWDGRATVWRIELRARGRALRLVDPRTRRICDLADPAALIDKRKLGLLWLRGTRLHSEQTGRRSTPRWRSVQAACALSLATPTPRGQATKRKRSRKAKGTARLPKQMRTMAARVVRGEVEDEELSAFLTRLLDAGRLDHWDARLRAARSALRPDARSWTFGTSTS